MLTLSTTLQILALSERVAMTTEHASETRIILPRAALDLPDTIAVVSRAYALLAV
jgi:hypothetical protein